jgi:phospholipid/cholesterol/gamma-HCH transport system permease protein
MPKYVIGLGTRDSMLLEFSSTMIALILAGKVGSNIASELGTMRITEQIDALEIMGVNSAGFLILPKLIASLVFFPLLTLMSMFIGIVGGYFATFMTDQVTTAQFLYGIHWSFNPFYITYSLIKMLVFAFIISTVSAYQGYYVEGGAVEVGKASTKAVVYSDVLILLFNVILTKLLLD